MSPADAGGGKNRAEAIVIGAGAAGLATAAELRRRGIDAVVLERAGEVATSWARRYDGLRLNTVRWLSAPRHSRIPRAAGRWPSRDAFVEHLRDFARRERLEIDFGVEVRRIDSAAPGFALDTSVGRRTARFVVVATGYDGEPAIPDWPGRPEFGARLIHASDYRRSEDFRADDVLVVGAGNSGTEIAVQLCRAGARRVRMAIRTPPNIVPLEILGIPITLFARLGEAGPDVFADWFGEAVRRLFWGDLRAYGLSRAPCGIGTELRERGLGPVVDRGFVSAVKGREIELVAAVDGFEGDRVRLLDGRRIQPSVVIAATGYRMGLERLVGHLGVLEPSGKPALVRGEADPCLPGLFFNGIWLPASGQLPAMRRTTRRIGRAIARQRRLAPTLTPTRSRDDRAAPRRGASGAR
jgi:putative flavoprotein involved in K+ transport